MTSRRFFAGFLVVALLVAGGASYYASTHPDGLEFVAGEAGFLDRADDSPTANSPLADYTTKGIDDARVSGGVAGVAGCLLVLGISFVVFRALRRRDDGGADTERDTERGTERDTEQGTPTTSGV